MWLLYAASAFVCMNDEVDEIPLDVVEDYVKFSIQQFDMVSLMSSLGRKYKGACSLPDFDVLESSNKKRKMVKYDRERAYRAWSLVSIENEISTYLDKTLRQDEIFLWRERFPLLT